MEKSLTSGDAGSEIHNDLADVGKHGRQVSDERTEMTVEPASKRAKKGPIPEAQSGAKTPDMASESQSSLARGGHVEQIPPASESAVPSTDFSGASHDSIHEGGSAKAESPPRAYASSSYRLPPAPPSTPASNTDTIAWDVGASTPLPIIRKGVENAARLEQQLLAEGATTPAPKPPPSSEATHASSSQQLPPDDFSDWAVGDRYDLKRILGRGSYGQVAQAVDLNAESPDAFVAIKRIQSPFDEEVDAIRLYREMYILRQMRGHECVIQLLDVVQPPTDDLDDFHDLYLVFEYVDTDLYKLIMSPQFLTTEHIQTFLYQMLAGLKYMHSFSVIHRDLKPANILLNEDCSLKICDFGLSRVVDASSMSTRDEEEVNRMKSPFKLGCPTKVRLTRQLTKHVVTRWYRAPELILIQPYTSAVDIWSLGCILAELLSMQEGNVPGYEDRKPLFPGGTCYPLSGEGDKEKGDDRLDQLAVIFGVIGTPSQDDIESCGKTSAYIRSLGKLEAKSLADIFPAGDPLALDLLQKMLVFNPKARYTADEALEHPFFKGIRRSEMEVTASKVLTVPEFLESSTVDPSTIKKRVYDEVLCYKDQGRAHDVMGR